MKSYESQSWVRTAKLQVPFSLKDVRCALRHLPQGVHSTTTIDLNGRQLCYLQYFMDS